jgi:hypothetical protein
VVTVATQVHDARDVPGYEALLQAATEARSAAWTRR